MLIELNSLDQYLQQLARGTDIEEPSHEDVQKHRKSSVITALAGGTDVEEPLQEDRKKSSVITGLSDGTSDRSFSESSSTEFAPLPDRTFRQRKPRSIEAQDRRTAFRVG